MVEHPTFNRQIKVQFLLNLPKTEELEMKILKKSEASNINEIKLASNSEVQKAFEKSLKKFSKVYKELEDK